MEDNGDHTCTDYHYLEEEWCNVVMGEEISFPEEKVEQLIEAIGAKPAIWNIGNEEYRNRVVTSKAWDDVLSEINLNKEYKNKARKRWDSLKSGYGRSKNAPSGSASKPRYKFSHLLSFLDDTREPRCTTSMMTSIESQPKTSCKTNKKDEPSPKNFQIEALKILKDINTPKAEIVKPKSFAALTCDMIQQDMETLPPLEQRALRNRLFEVVDEAVTRHHRRVGN